MKAINWVVYTTLIIASINTTWSLAASTIAAPAPTAAKTSGADLRNEEGGNTERHLPEWVNNLIAFLNLLIVAGVYIHSVCDRRKEKAQDERRKQNGLKQSVGIFWVQELVMSPNLGLLHDFFLRYEQEMLRLSQQPPAGSCAQAGSDAVHSITEFKDSFYKIKQRIVEPLVSISPLFQGLYAIMSDIQDLVTAEYIKIPGLAVNNNEMAVIRFRELRRQFLAEIYTVQKDFVGIAEEKKNIAN